MRTARDNFWLDAPYEPGSTLWGEHETDVAIVGGGFTGMATAYFIKQYCPEKTVVVLEGEFVGFGSSGRNSGMATSLLGGNIISVLKAKGVAATARLHQLAAQSISLVEELIRKHDIDCDFEKNGSMAVAENGNEVGSLEKMAKAYEKIGATTNWFEGEEARGKFGGSHVLAALCFPDEGMLNPAKFVRGMKGVVESLGVEVYEHSRCTSIEPGSVASLYTPGGVVKAKNVVIATNAYANPLGLFRYRVLPFYVYDIVTEPLTHSQLDALHLPGRENVAGTKHIGWGLRLTADNRLLFTEVDALYFRNIDRDFSHRPSEYRSHYRLLVRKFPFLNGIKATHQWGGRVGITFDFLPSIGRTGNYNNVYYSIGYNGYGLATSQLAGKIIAELMAGKESELTDHILINRRLLGFPSKSAIYLAANGYKMYFKMLDRLLDIGR